MLQFSLADYSAAAENFASSQTVSLSLSSSLCTHSHHNRTGGCKRSLPEIAKHIVKHIVPLPWPAEVGMGLRGRPH